MNEQEKELIKGIFERHPEIGVAYFFGSRAKGAAGPTSDYDFAVYIDSHDPKVLSDLKRALRNELSLALESDAVDLVVLNTANMPELKYAIVQEGKVLFERESFRALIEPIILNEYFDFRDMLRRYRLTLA